MFQPEEAIFCQIFLKFASCSLSFKTNDCSVYISENLCFKAIICNRLLDVTESNIYFFAVIITCRPAGWEIIKRIPCVCVSHF